jgi:hypothetical protein
MSHVRIWSASSPTGQGLATVPGRGIATALLPTATVGANSVVRRVPTSVSALDLVCLAAGLLCSSFRQSVYRQAQNDSKER